MIHPHMQSELLGRIRPGLPFSDSVKDAALASFGLAAKLKTEKERIDNDRGLSSQGKRNAIQAVVKDLAVQCAENGRPARKALSHAKVRRQGLGPKPIDRTDLFAELQRQEKRAFLSKQDGATRAHLAMFDPDFTEAVLHAPAAMSGLKPDVLSKVRQTYIETHFTGDLREIGEVEDAYSVAATANSLLRLHLQQASEMHPHQFEALMKPIEAAADAD